MRTQTRFKGGNREQKKHKKAVAEEGKARNKTAAKEAQ